MVLIAWDVGGVAVRISQPIHNPNSILSLQIHTPLQAGKNVVVAARAVQGGLRAGSKVLVLPIGDVATVRVCMGVYACRGIWYAHHS